MCKLLMIDFFKIKGKELLLSFLSKDEVETCMHMDHEIIGKVSNKFEISININTQKMTFNFLFVYRTFERFAIAFYLSIVFC